MNSLAALGRWSMQRVERLGCASLFLYELVASAWHRAPQRGVGAGLRKALRLVVQQMYMVGVYTLLIIIVSSLFVGMVLGLQGYVTLVDFGAESSLGLLVALSLTRELGPVITALLFAGRAGSALTAEIGLMKATEQLAAMEMMAVNPIGRVVAPRFWAGVISMPLLAALFSAMGIFGAYIVGVRLLGVDDGAFWSQMQAAVDFRQDVINGVIKSMVFGLGISLVATFEGYDALPTAEGVSRATTRTVVHSSLLILALDLIMTGFMLQTWGS